MRIPGSKVYRAFPELDPFPDESCRKFVQAATRGVIRKALIATVVLPIAVFGFGCAVYLWMLGLDVLEKSTGHRIDALGLWMLPLAAILLIMALVGVLPAIFARDLMLRISLSRVLRDSGTCFSCGYGLIGLPANRENEGWWIRCPECQARCEVDSSLAVLSPEGGGRVVLERVLVSQEGWRHTWFPRLLRWARLSGIGLGVVVAAAAVLIAGFYIFSWVQASRAARDIVPHATLQAMLTQAFADQTDHGGGTVEKGIEPIHARVREIRFEATHAPYASLQFEHFIEALGMEQAPEEENDERARQRRTLAREIHEVYSHEGLLGAIARLKGKRAGVEFGVSNLTWWTRSSAAVMIGEGAIWEYGTAVAVHGWRNGDEEGFVQAVDAMLVLARHLQGQPNALEWMMGAKMESDVLAALRTLVSEPRHAGKVAWIERAIEGHSEGVTASRATSATMLLMRALIATGFSHAAEYRSEFAKALQDKVRELVFGQGARWGGASRMPGSYTSNKEYLLEVEQEILTNLSLPPTKRQRAHVSPPGGVVWSAPWSLRLEGETDRLAFERAAASAMIAIEKHRLAHGDYPRTLADAMPGSHSGSAVDQGHSQAFGYRTVSPGEDKQGRGYLLYTLGTDGVDDHGAGDDTVLNHPSYSNISDMFRRR